jgi:hypothetical protein
MVAPYLNPTPTSEPQEGLVSKWRGWLQQPDNRAALLQFGVNMLQPMGPGQTFWGQLGQSLGAAGQTVQTRQQQRQKAADAAAARAMDVAQLAQGDRRLDLTEQGQQQQYETDQAAAERGNRALDIQQQNADTASTRASRGTAAGQITPAFVARAKQSALTSYDKYSDAAFLNGNTPMSREDYVDQYLSTMGLTPDQISGAAFARSGDLIAGGTTTIAKKGPRGTATGPTPQERIDRGFSAADSATPASAAVKLSSAEYLQRYPQQWTRIQQLLQSADPREKARGQLFMQQVQQNVADPQNLVGR